MRLCSARFALLVYSLLAPSDCNVSLHITLELFILVIHTVFQVLESSGQTVKVM